MAGRATPRRQRTLHVRQRPQEVKGCCGSPQATAKRSWQWRISSMWEFAPRKLCVQTCSGIDALACPA